MATIKVDFDLLDEKSRGKIVKGSVIPRPIAWISTLNENGSVNLAPFSFFNAVSSTLLVVSFSNNDLKTKDTFINITREKEAVVHIVDELLLEKMDLTSEDLDYNQSEVIKNNLTLSASNKLKTPGIAEALIRLEVVLEESLPLLNYQKNQKDADLVILRVVGGEISDQVYDQKTHHIFADKLQPVARLGGSDYSGLNVLRYKREFK